MHIFGTCLGIILLVLALVIGSWWLLVGAVMAGYGFAWSSHAFIERNKPATFSYP